MLLIFTDGKKKKKSNFSNEFKLKLITNYHLKLLEKCYENFVNIIFGIKKSHRLQNSFFYPKYIFLLASLKIYPAATVGRVSRKVFVAAERKK